MLMTMDVNNMQCMHYDNVSKAFTIANTA